MGNRHIRKKKNLVREREKERFKEGTNVVYDCYLEFTIISLPFDRVCLRLFPYDE